MQHTVFISHSVKDVDKDAAERVYSYLVRNGIRCFMDTKDLIAGKQYHIQLAEAVKASNIVVLILSSNSDSSEAVGNEIAIARNNRISIIPLRIEDIIPDKLAFFLTTSQWMDAFPPPIENHLPKLVDAIKQHVSGDKLPDSQHFTNDEGETTTQPVSAPVKPSDKITFGSTVTDHKWHDVDFHQLRDWVKKRKDRLDKGEEFAGKVWRYRQDKHTGKYQIRLRYSYKSAKYNR